LHAINNLVMGKPKKKLVLSPQYGLPGPKHSKSSAQSFAIKSVEGKNSRGQTSDVKLEVAQAWLFAFR
jgi:hypothetical protein